MLSDLGAQLVVGERLIGVLLVDVLAGESEQLVVVFALGMLAAERAIDRAHENDSFAGPATGHELEGLTLAGKGALGCSFP
jgi:hypothetical protein